MGHLSVIANFLTVHFDRGATILLLLLLSELHKTSMEKLLFCYKVYKIVYQTHGSIHKHILLSINMPIHKLIVALYAAANKSVPSIKFTHFDLTILASLANNFKTNININLQLQIYASLTVHALTKALMWRVGKTSFL